MKLKRLVALLVCLLMIFGLSGCVANVYETTATIDGYEISSGLYLMAQFTAYTEAERLVEDAERDVFAQKIEGKNANDWIKDRTEELLLRYVAVRRLCRERDLFIDQTGQQAIEQRLQGWSAIEPIYTDNGISAMTFQRYLTAEELSRVLFNSLYAEGGEFAVTDEVLQAEFAEVSAHVRMISIPTAPMEDGTSVREEVINRCRSILEKLNAGSTMEEVVTTDVADIYAFIGRDYDTETAMDNIFDNWVSYDDDSGVFSPEELELLRTQQSGDYGIVITESTVIIYEKREIFDDEETFQSRRANVLQVVKEDDFENYLSELYSTYEVNWTFLARWSMRPKKIVIP